MLEIRLHKFRIWILSYAIFRSACVTVPQNGDQDVVLIPTGTFAMEHDTKDKEEEWGNRDEGPVHQIYLSAYWIDQYEVTASEFPCFLNEHKEEAARYFERVVRLLLK